jgi:aminoglycoside 2'-N-acetyltransferase I
MTHPSDGPPQHSPRGRVRRLSTHALTAAETATIRALLDAAFGDDEDERFTEEDWQHSIGGVHAVLDVDGEIVAHASVVERSLHVAGRAVRTGYVEAVATAPEHQGRGYGTQVMEAIGDEIRAGYELGALGTGEIGFYERLGWRVWAGPTSVRTPDGERRTPDEDGAIMVLMTPSTPEIELDAPISCEWRPGDVW